MFREMYDVPRDIKNKIMGDTVGKDHRSCVSEGHIHMIQNMSVG